jgi:hypothetical protein
VNDHPFATEVRQLIRAIPHGRAHVCYSRPAANDTLAEGFDATGHLSQSVFDSLTVTRHWFWRSSCISRPVLPKGQPKW